MKKNMWNFILLSLLICLLTFLISGCIIGIKKTTTIEHLDDPWCSFKITQEYEVIRDPEEEDNCTVLLGVRIPEQWQITVDTFQIEGDLYTIQVDAGVTAELNDSFPPEPGYKWVGFETDSSINTVIYPDTAMAVLIYEINRNLPTGPRWGMVYERLGEGCQHQWWPEESSFLIKDTPTLTQWGIIILVGLIVASGVFILLSRRRKAAVPA